MSIREAAQHHKISIDAVRWAIMQQRLILGPGGLDPASVRAFKPTKTDRLPAKCSCKLYTSILRERPAAIDELTWFLIDLYAGDHVSHALIADHLALTPGQVRLRIREGIQMLQRLERRGELPLHGAL